LGVRFIKVSYHWHLQKLVPGVPGFLAGDEISDLIRTRMRPSFAELVACRSLRELTTCVAYHGIRDDLQRVLHTPQGGYFRGMQPQQKDRYRVLAWNIERGKELPRQIEALKTHSYLRDCDVLLLVETDIGMARSGNLDVARTIASELGMDYAFAPCYLSLVKGSGVERQVDGENDVGLHGNAILSRYPMDQVAVIPLENGIDKIACREKRLGRQSALQATIRFPNFTATVVCSHLDANSTQRHRAAQMETILDSIPQSGPTLIGGDWNTTTFDSSTAFRAIMGYWLRVMMGPDNVIRNHYLHPYRRFEKDLFALLEAHGYEYRESNQLGEYTIYYDVEDLRTYAGLSEWVPQWCFPFIRWALRNHNGRCPLKIDWFASRDMRVENPRVIHDLGRESGSRLSDHDAIGVEIVS
jgi:endonuclease/exonuclease/phosphatase family metal-dependent hydrolase